MPSRESIAIADDAARKRTYAAAASICGKAGIDRDSGLPETYGHRELNPVHDRELFAALVETLDRLLPVAAKGRTP
jgi:hypothetical protein